ADDVRDRLAPFGVGERAAVLAFELTDPSAAEPTLAEFLSSQNRPALVAPHPAGRREPPCAGGRGGKGDPPRPAGGAPKAPEGAQGPTRAATSRTLPTERVRHSFHEARCALEATGFSNGAAPQVASHRDLGAFTLLLSVQDAEALRLYCESVLGPIEDSD